MSFHLARMWLCDHHTSNFNTLWKHKVWGIEGAGRMYSQQHASKTYVSGIESTRFSALELSHESCHVTLGLIDVQMDLYWLHTWRVSSQQSEQPWIFEAYKKHLTSVLTIQHTSPTLHAFSETHTVAINLKGQGHSTMLGFSNLLNVWANCTFINQQLLQGRRKVRRVWFYKSQPLTVLLTVWYNITHWIDRCICILACYEVVVGLVYTIHEDNNGTIVTINLFIISPATC